MMLCQHEEIAVQIAHGYAKATGKPMAVILHNLVGLLHACMAIYYAYIDRVPIFIIGATGPMDEGKRRPHIDWTHSALVQGNAVRDYVKWDYQPTSIDGVPESFARAYSIMMTEPQGPVYMCYDAALQEAPLDARRAAAARRHASRRPSPMAPDPARDRGDRRQAAHGRASACCWRNMPAGAPAASRASSSWPRPTGAAVWDVNNALNFPNKHPLCLSMDKDSLQAHRSGRRPRRQGLGEAAHRAQQRQAHARAAHAAVVRFRRDRLRRDQHQQMGDGLLPHAAVLDPGARRHRARHPGAHPHLQASASPATPSSRAASPTRKRAIGKRHDEVWAKWQEEARKDWDASPITFSRLALEVWDVIKDEDWVLTANNLKQQVRKLWDFDKPYRHPGVELGTSTQIGISLGVALAHKGKGRIVVDIQPDGDLMFDAGALWVAAKYEIPMLVVMHNNRAYYNDWEHQIRMAKLRGTDEAKAHIGMDLFGPEPDFAALARSMGCYGEGPIDKPQDVRPALLRALAEVKKGRLALVDTITQHR